MFSVIIPLYNKELTIRNTINSVLNQTYQDFEIIVINDGSTDSSAKITESINDDRIRLIHQTNQGVSAARNKGIEESRYNWLALLDGDDEWEYDYLENILQAIKKDSECIAYCTNFKKLDFSRKSVNIIWKYVPKEEGRIDNYYKACFFSSPIVTSSSVCLSKEKLNVENLLSLFPLGVKSGEDIDTWVRALRSQSLYVINRKLVNINVIQEGTEHLKERASGEFDYKIWFRYKCSTAEKSFWLKLYAVKKLYENLKKEVVIKMPWIYDFYKFLKWY